MWGKPAFSISDNCAVDVRNLGAARKWYEEKLGFREAPDKREEDSGWPFVNLCISNDGLARTLLEREAGTPPTNGHVIFFAKNLEKARQWLVERQVSAESTTEDSGGNRLFRFFDLDENPVEVCVEP